jgi:hypothetical protein
MLGVCCRQKLKRWLCPMNARSCMTKSDATEKKKFVHKRDVNGHLVCERCGFKPKATPRHPKGNPSTMTYHLKKHDGDFAYKCRICNWNCLHKQTLDTHMATRHPEALKEKPTKYKCPIEGCMYESITKAGRRIHFVRKHCGDEATKYQKTTKVEDKITLECSCCQQNFNSGTAFHYHLAGCWLEHQILPNSLLEKVC